MIKKKNPPQKISQWESPEFDRLIPHLLPVWTRITWLPKTWLPGADGQLFPRSQSWESGCLWAGLLPVCLGWKTLALNTFCQVAFWQKPTQRSLAESFVGWSLFCWKAGIVKGHKSSGSSSNVGLKGNLCAGLWYESNWALPDRKPRQKTFHKKNTPHHVTVKIPTISLKKKMCLNS